MKKTLLALITCLASFQVMASINMDVNAGYSGAYVTITENGEALNGVTVIVSDKENHQAQTNDQGFTYLPIRLDRTRLLTFTATTTDGKSVSKEVFITDNDFSTTTNRHLAQ